MRLPFDVFDVRDILTNALNSNPSNIIIRIEESELYYKFLSFRDGKLEIELNCVSRIIDFYDIESILIINRKGFCHGYTNLDENAECIEKKQLFVMNIIQLSICQLLLVM